MKKIIQNIFYIGLISFLGLQKTFGDLEGSIKPVGNSNTLNPTSGNIGLASIFKWFRGELTTIVFVIAVAVFVFIGIRMATSRGNPEEFKKAWTHFVYAVIGIFIVFLAISIVRLISNLASTF